MRAHRCAVCQLPLLASASAGVTMHREGFFMSQSQWSAIVSEAETARCGGKAVLAAALQDARARTLALFDAYEAALGPTLCVPCTPELNPPLWELGHIGWFCRLVAGAKPAAPSGR